MVTKQKQKNKKQKNKNKKSKKTINLIYKQIDYAIPKKEAIKTSHVLFYISIIIYSLLYLSSTHIGSP
jgi:hypothetical protein